MPTRTRSAGDRLRPGWGALAGAALALACSGHAERTRDVRTALDANNPQAALAALNEQLEVDSADQLPDELGGDNALLILDRSMVLQQLRDFENSARDLRTADKQIEYLDFSRTTLDDIGNYVFSGDGGPYKAPPYEKLLINSMNLVNYLAMGDLNGARIEARRLAVMQRYLKDSESPDQALMGPGSYFAGFAFEKSGRAQEALRYYDEALRYGEYRSLHEPVRRLAARATYRSPRIRRILGEQPPAASGPTSQLPNAAVLTKQADGDESEEATGTDEPATVGDATTAGNGSESTDSDPNATPASDTSSETTSEQQAGASGDEARDDEPPGPEPGEILAVINFGRVPAKKAKRVPIGLALTWASGAISPNDHARANALAAQGLVTWVNFPELGKPRGQFDVPGVALDGQWQNVDGLLAVDREVRAAWDRVKGPIVGAAIVRTISRLVAGEAVRRGSGGGVAGLLLSLGTQATLSAADTPDTRSWATLPARIAASRMRVSPGRHRVELVARGYRWQQTVDVKPGGWAVVVLTVLS